MRAFLPGFHEDGAFLVLVVLELVEERQADAMIAWFRQYAARRLNSRIIDERRTIPPYVVLDLGNQGFFGLQIPAKFGGKALDTVDLMRVLTLGLVVVARKHTLPDEIGLFSARSRRCG